jgi:peptide-N4-(N-acetyl-beta-glucosaminyl)asparagine amidase
MSCMCSQIVVEVDGSMVDDGTDLEATFERMRLLVVGEDDVEAEAARVQEKSHEELARMLQVHSHI